MDNVRPVNDISYSALGNSDPLYEQAVEVVRRNKRASISLIKDNLRIGYNRSALLLEQMEKNGVVGVMSTNGNRNILNPQGAASVPIIDDRLGDDESYGRVFCNQMVHDSWRSFLTSASRGYGAEGIATIAKLEDDSQRISRTMEATRSRRFLAMIEDERSKIADEYAQNPNALKRRLGVRIPEVSPTQVSLGRSRQSLGELAVKTAVRATVWETIRIIFRSFR